MCVRNFVELTLLGFFCNEFFLSFGFSNLVQEQQMTMSESMFDQIINKTGDGENPMVFFEERRVSPKTILLREGETSNHIYFIKEGCLRLWFNKNGKDITVQFFFEGQAVASIDSFVSNQPSMFSLESIEAATVYSISKGNFEQLQQLHPGFRDSFQKLLFQRFRNYARLFLSRIKDSPRERYDELVADHPEIIQRVPQHYIASYLGITPISLSRIRNRR